MEREQKPPEDSFLIRCSKLGHQIHFSYCRKENFGLPCGRILTCWHPYFKVDEYLRGELTDQEWQDTFKEPGKSKVLTLVEIIEEAQKRKREEGE